MSQRPWNLGEANLEQIRSCDWQVAILPLGATEPHNLHLPYATDTLQVDVIVDEICNRAWQQGAKVLALPALPFGTESNLREFPFAMNLKPSTVFTVLTDLLNSLTQSGIRKLLVMNGHGGNDLKPWLREIYGQTEANVFLCNWFTVLKDRSSEIFEHPEDHAGEMETSLIMAIRPDLIGRTADGELSADDGAVREFRFQALSKGWVSMTRPWHLLTKNSGSGNPLKATPDKGRQTMELLCERLVPFLVQLATAEVDPLFPFAGD